MMNMLKKIETASKSVIALTGAITTTVGLLLGIYHGIYKLNQTVSSVVSAIPLIQENQKFSQISIDYDIALAEQQLYENDNIDRILMRKLLLYEKDLSLNSNQVTSINYLKSKTNFK